MATYDHAISNDTKLINLVEPNSERLHEAMHQLNGLLTKEQADKISPFQKSSVLVWERSDVAESCAPHEVNLTLTEEAIEFDVPFCDLGGCGKVVEEQAKLARDTGCSIVPDCGVSPGSTNIFEVDLAKAGYKHIRAYCGGNPSPRPDPATNPLLYKEVYNMYGLTSGYAGWCYEIEDGHVIQVPALDQIKHYSDEFEAAPTSHHSRFSIEHLKSLGVESCSYQTLRYHGHYEELTKGGWRFDCEPHFLAERLKRKPELYFDREKDLDRLTLHVSDASNQIGYRYDVVRRKGSPFTAMEVMTGLGINLVARHMMIGKGRPDGFAMPQEFVDPFWYRTELDTLLVQYGYGSAIQHRMPVEYQI